MGFLHSHKSMDSTILISNYYLGAWHTDFHSVVIKTRNL
jgi:hypothetical protein